MGCRWYLTLSEEDFEGAAYRSLGADRLTLTTPGTVCRRFKTNYPGHDYQSALRANADAQSAAIAPGNVNYRSFKHAATSTKTLTPKTGGCL